MLMDSKTRWLTPNNTALYTLGFFGLKKDGPTVIEVPPGYRDPVPDGCHVYRSKTCAVWNFMRGCIRTSVKDAADNVGWGDTGAYGGGKMRGC
jgi:hypothetical protein